MSKMLNVGMIIENRCGEDENVQIMMTMPYIGIVREAIFMAKVENVIRFSNEENSQHISKSRRRLARREKNNGADIHEEDIIVPSLCRSRLLRSIHTFGHDSKISNYQQLKNEAIGGKNEIVASSRKILESLCYMMTRKHTFRTI